MPGLNEFCKIRTHPALQQGLKTSVSLEAILEAPAG